MDHLNSIFMNIKKEILLICTFTIIIQTNGFAGLLINEATTAMPDGDWVELFFYSDIDESRNISNLYVTMYHGDNERLGSESITIYSYDKPETRYDDRFVVVHLTKPYIEDETDLTGDTNQNGYIDVYCNNYYNSLWNSDCILSITTSDEIENDDNVIFDFLAYSNRDGTPNDTIASYVNEAQALNQWESRASDNIQECMVDIGIKGLDNYMSICRKNNIDTNSQNDFTITKYITPGKENIIENSVSSNRKLFKVSKKKISVTPTHFLNRKNEIKIFVFEYCNIRFRIFSSIGMLVYESPLFQNIFPGNFNLPWNLNCHGKIANTGLFFAHIEATGKKIKKSQTEKIYLILSRY